MSTFRFALLSVGVFALTFVGILLGTNNFPVVAMSGEAAEPVAQNAQAQADQPQARPAQPMPTPTRRGEERPPSKA